MQHTVKRCSFERSSPGRIAFALGTALVTLTSACGGGPQTLFEQTNEQAQAAGMGLSGFTADQGEVVVHFSPWGAGEALIARVSGGATTPLVEGVQYVTSIKLHGDTLYFREQNFGPIEKVPLAGGERQEVGDPGREGCYIEHVLADRLLLDCFDEMLALPLSGGAPQQVFAGVAPWSMIEGDDLYLVHIEGQLEGATRTVKRVPLSGGAAETLWDAGAITLSGIAVTPEAVLVMEVAPMVGQEKLGRVHSIPKEGGSATLLGEVSGAWVFLGDGTRGFVVVDEAFGSGPVEFHVVPVDASGVGGPTIALDAVTRQHAINDGSIYWLQDNDDGTTTSLRRSPL